MILGHDSLNPKHAINDDHHPDSTTYFSSMHHTSNLCSAYQTKVTSETVAPSYRLGDWEDEKDGRSYNEPFTD